MLVDDVCLFHVIFSLVFLCFFFVFAVLETEVGIERSAFILQNSVDAILEWRKRERVHVLPGLNEICTIEVLFKVARK